MKVLVDVLSYKIYALISVLAAGFLLLAFIIGALGPDTYTSRSYTAYQCPHNSHIWNPDTCQGMQLSVGNSTWSGEFLQFSAMNVLWILEVTPYKNQSLLDTHIDTSMAFAVTILGSSNENRWTTIVHDDQHVNQMVCDAGKLGCKSFVLVDVQNLEYPYYQVQIWLPPSNAKELVGDVEFTLFTYNTNFTDMELGFRLSYLLIGLIVFIVYLWRLRSVPVGDWDYEQKWTVILLMALVLLNDPFYPLEFWVRGWFFEFLHSVFETIFTAVLLSFWLCIVEKQRKGDEMKFTLLHLPQFACVLIYTCLSTVLFTLIRTRAAKDPVYGERDNVVAEIVLFYLVTISYGVLIVWFLVETTLTIVVVTRLRYPVKRLTYFEVPGLLCVLSIIVGMFTGTVGPFNRTSLGFVYYFAMYNLYVWLMAVGFWPVDKVGYVDPTADPDNNYQENEVRPTTVPRSPSERDSILSLHENL